MAIGQAPIAARAPRRADAALPWVIALAVFIVCAWCGQGEGVNQNAHFAAIRSLVERGTFDITPLRDRTCDIVTHRGHVYSNKPPGLALLGAAPYWVLLHVERLVGVASPDVDPRIDRFNLDALTVLLASGSVAAVVVAMFFFLRRDCASARESAMIALALAFGSTLLPYSTMLYNHALVTACLFGAFVLVSSSAATTATLALASALLGLCIASDYSAAPAAAIVVACAVWQWRDWRRGMLLCVGPALAFVGLLLYQRAIFGGAMQVSYVHPDPGDPHANLYPPLFNAPEWSRLYWITFHRERGLFYCSPMFVLPLVSLALWMGSRPARRFRLEPRRTCALLVVAYYVMLMLTYNSWAGGSGSGPRFFMPALPFLFLFASLALRRLPWIAWPLIALSIFNVIALAAVQPDYPGHVTGPPLHWDPVGVCALDLLRGQVALNPTAYNLGLLLGLKGAWSIVPMMGLIVASFLAVRWMTRGATSAVQEPLDIETSPAKPRQLGFHEQHLLG